MPRQPTYVDMKEPIGDKDVPAVGSELKLLKDGGPELDGTYDTYTQVPASSTAAASAQISLKDGILQLRRRLRLASRRLADRPATHQ